MVLKIDAFSGIDSKFLSNTHDFFECIPITTLRITGTRVGIDSATDER